MSNKLVLGSLANIASTSGKSIAETFIDVDAVIIVDISGSMSSFDSCDNHEGQTRWHVAGQELVKLQQTMPGKLAVIAFSNNSRFEPTGILPPVGVLGHGTNLAGALQFAAMLDMPGMQFVVISDGQPNNQEAAIKAAKAIKANISTVYVGPTGGNGAAFLAKLASQSGGQNACVGAVELSGTVQRLLLTS